MKEQFIIAGGFEHDTFTRSMPMVAAALDEETGQLTLVETHTDAYNYGYICRNHAGNRVYGLETRLDQGGVVTYEIGEDGKAVLLSEMPLEESVFGIYCTVSHDDRYLIACFASSSTVYSLKLDEEGVPVTVADVFKLPEGVHTTERQKSGPAPHQAQFDRTGKYLIIPDIHSDRIFCMAFDKDKGKMTEVDCVHIEAGQGPRHVSIHPNNRWVYLLTEIGTSLYFLEFDQTRGKLTIKEHFGLVPQDYIDANPDKVPESAAIAVSPDGRFVLATMRGYADERGHDRIFTVGLDQDKGTMGRPKHFSSQGDWPRMMAFSNDGHYLLVGNQFSHDLVSLRYDSASGTAEVVCGRVRAEGNASFCCIG